MIGMLNEKKRKYLLLLLSIVIIVVYSAIYWNRVIPFTDGWGIYILCGINEDWKISV